MKPDALAHLADALMEDIIATPPHQLAIEEIVDAGRSRELVFRFDDILAEAGARRRERTGTRPTGALWNLTDALCEDIAAAADEDPHSGAADGDRFLAAGFDGILNRNPRLTGSRKPRRPGPPPAALSSPGWLAGLAGWLTAPLRRPAAAGAFTIAAAAVVIAVLLQPHRTPDRGFEVTSLEPPPATRPTPGIAAPDSDEKDGGAKGDPAASVQRKPAPPVRVAGPLDIAGPLAGPMTGSGSLRAWLGSLQPHDDAAVMLKELESIAGNGDVTALWKLGRIYADGDEGPQDDLRAFDCFRRIIEIHGANGERSKETRLVADAYVRLGLYYLRGVAGGVRPDPARARQLFMDAATHLENPDAQYHLGRAFLDGEGGSADLRQAARWLHMAAMKGHPHAQAALGSLLFKGDRLPRDAPRGLMWLQLANDAAQPDETWIKDLFAAAWMQATEYERTTATALVEKWRREKSKPEGGRRQ